MFILDESIIKDLLFRTLRSRPTYADIYTEKRSSTVIVLENGIIDKISSGKDSGIGIRTIAGKSCNYSFSNDFSSQSLLEMVSSISTGENLSQKRTIDLTRRSPSVRLPVNEPGPESSIEKKIALMRKVDRIARKHDPAVRQVSVSYSDQVQDILIANSDQFYSTEKRVYTALSINIIATDDTIIQTGREIVGGMYSFDALQEELDIEEITLNAVERSVRMLHSRHSPSGRMPVVISSEAGGTMIHEAIGHGLEADLVQNGLSVYKDRLTQEVATPLVTIVDDSTLPGKRGSFLFDDEGTLSQKTLLVENGILKSYMYDIFTSLQEKRGSTGNGRRQSYRHKPIPRMTNTVLLPGNTPPGDIIQGVQSGLFVKKMGGGQVNTVSGDFVFDVQDARIIENGQLGEHVRGATLTGNGPDVLFQIDQIGNDLGFSLGTCGKDSQGIPVTDALPTIRIQELVVGGKS